MDENHRREHTGGYISPIDQLVEIIQFASVVEAKEDERDQTENVKVLCFIGTAAPEVNEQSNREVGEPDKVEVVHRRVWLDVGDDDRHLDFDAATPHQIIGFVPRPDANQDLCDIEGL